MSYKFKKWEELVWFCLVAVLPVLLTALASYDPATIGDIQVWAVSIMAAAVRALGGALLAWLARQKLEE